MTTTFYKRYLFLFIYSLITIPAFSTVYTSANNGEFTESSTWSPNGVPGIGDDVIIDGHFIILSGSAIATVRNITIRSNSNASTTGLNTVDNAQLFASYITVTAMDNNGNIKLEIEGNSEVTVDSLLIARTDGNNKSKYCRLVLRDHGSLVVNNDFQFYYGNSGSFEFTSDIRIGEFSTLEVGGRSDFIMKNGASFAINVLDSAQVDFVGDVVLEGIDGFAFDLSLFNDAKIECKKNLTIKNDDVNKIDAYLNNSATLSVDSNLILNSLTDGREVVVTSSNSETLLDIGQDIVFDATADENVEINLNSGGSVRLCGKFSRSPFGTLKMGDEATLVYSGFNPQTIATETKSGSGNDAFNFTNIKIENTSGVPIDLPAPLTVYNDFNITNGIVRTTSTNILTLEDGATITGGSSTAYIDGPMIKRGSTNGQPFIFPLGGGNQFAPIEISALSNSTDQYIAQYYGCPPPFGNDIDPAMSRISGTQYWTLEKNGVGTPDVDVTLHWTDAEKQGIDDTTSLVVAFFQVDEARAEDSEWISMGRSNASGSLGTGMAGNITNAYGCPPPFGNDVARSFTFGSTSQSRNALPVEMISFAAKTRNEAVYIEWRTANEINSDYFEVERSSDGFNFEVIEEVAAAGNSIVEQSYLSIDKNPSELNYYRLRQVDLDGTYTYSDIIVLSVENGGKPVLFPNPVINEINLYTEGYSTGEVQVTIYDQRGRSVFREVYPMQNAAIRIDEYQIGDLGPGTYYIETINEFGSNVQPFMKINM